DVLLEVFLRCNVLDILSLKQTCRMLYALGSSDYLWHRIVPTIRIPLEIPADVDSNSLSGAELQRIVIKAIRLEHNWRKPTSRITRMTPVLQEPGGVPIDEMRLLPGARWLVTAQRNRPLWRLSTTISLWCLEDVDAIYRSAQMEITGTYRDLAIVSHPDCSWVSLAIGMCIGDHEVIQVHKLPMLGRLDFTHVPQSPIKSIPRPRDLPGVIHEVSIHGDIVAASFVVADDALNHHHQLLLINYATGVQQMVDPKFVERFTNFSIRLAHGQIILVGILNQSFAMRIYGLPDTIFPGNTTCPESQGEGLGPIAFSFNVIPTPSLSLPDFAISDSINIPRFGRCSRLSMVSFDVRGSHIGGGNLVHFCTENLNGGGQPPSQPQVIEPRKFVVPGSTSIEFVKIGTRGHRAVWLEHDWESQRFRLMKLSAPVASSGVLLPPDPELPFSPRECQSLAFDEVTGRVCLGLYTGSLYILDFV
ncbi:hypothetical protein BJ322DRAFT_1015641, partial [Thelephora terrestris]